MSNANRAALTARAQGLHLPKDFVFGGATAAFQI